MASASQRIGTGCMVAFFSGCSSIVSGQHPETLPDINTLEGKSSGLVYMLPRRLVQLTVQRKPIPSDLNQKIAMAKAEVESKKDAFNKASAVLAEAEGLLQALRNAEEASEGLLKKAEEAVITARAQRTMAEAAATKANKDLADLETLRDMLLTAPRSDDPKQRVVTYDINLQLQPAQGDPTEVYVAQLAHYPWRDDTVTLKTTPEGLLTTGDANVVDQTSDILINIASALAAFGIAPVTPPPSPPGFLEGRPRKRVPLACAIQVPLTLQWIFDPTEPSQQNGINASLISCKVPYRIMLNALGADDSPNLDWKEELAQRKPQGLLYRRPIPYVVEVQRDQQPDTQTNPPNKNAQSESDNSSNQEERYETEQATMVMLPNKGPLGLIPYNASGFVTTDYKVEFKDGAPVAWSANRPSELASVFRIPVAIAKAIVQIPAELIKLRFDVATNSAAETKAKLDLLCAQLALDAAEKLRSNQTTEIAPTLPLCDPATAGGS